jgi:hypothetical protein
MLMANSAAEGRPAGEFRLALCQTADSDQPVGRWRRGDRQAQDARAHHDAKTGHHADLLEVRDEKQ